MSCQNKVTGGNVTRPPSEGLNVSRGSGRASVSYRDAKGIRRDGIIVAPGSGSGLKIYLPEQNRTVDNVAAMSAIKGTNVYDTRH